MPSSGKSSPDISEHCFKQVWALVGPLYLGQILNISARQLLWANDITTCFRCGIIYYRGNVSICRGKELHSKWTSHLSLITQFRECFRECRADLNYEPFKFVIHPADLIDLKELCHCHCKIWKYRVFFITGAPQKLTSMEKSFSIRTGAPLKFTSMEKN